ncbi:MAG: PQQ-binding-like beta-propeller repeat protein [Gemmatimonas sp.]|nr:PQQ-binding-like beta-propeller repeat protein [Gemmatimonas sp.]
MIGDRKRPLSVFPSCRAPLWALVGVTLLSTSAAAQHQGTPYGEWRYWGGSASMTRYSPLDQINAENFEDLEVAWIWRGDNFGPDVDYILRSTPIYANGKLYTVAGQRRTVAAIDPATGETLWTYREPHTSRWERSPRQNYGKGVAYAEIDGRGIIYVVTPGFFLHALDAETGLPLEGFGRPVPVEGFGEHGTVDLLADLGHPWDPEYGVPDSIGMITNSSPPIVVNGVVVVGNSHQTGRLDTREENVPGDILAYDARTGEHLWKFNVIPRPGEFGHETWENDAWSRVGNVSSWAPMSADLERGIVYIPTDPPTNDYYGGFHPGDNLFGNSVLALDVRTGQRVWHFQAIHHDIWDWDFPAPPIVLDVVVEGQPTPIVVQTSKQANVYTLNRVTGEPIWPIVERPVPQTDLPGEQTSPTQPFPTRPAPYEMQGLTEDDLIDFTPELRAMALDTLSNYRWQSAFFNPPIHRDNPEGLRGAINCPGSGGGTNIPGGAVADPESGILYVAHVRACTARVLVPGSEMDQPDVPNDRFRGRTGRTVVRWVDGGGTGFSGPEGLPIFKPPYGRITAIDMNTGEHLWWIPNGDTPERIRNHPRLQGLDIPNTGQPSHATALVTRTLLMYGEGRGGLPRFHAVDKRTGERLGTVELPGTTDTPPMTFMHEGRQYIVGAISGGDLPGSLVALRLP